MSSKHSLKSKEVQTDRIPLTNMYREQRVLLRVRKGSGINVYQKWLTTDISFVSKKVTTLI